MTPRLNITIIAGAAAWLLAVGSAGAAQGNDPARGGRADSRTIQQAPSPAPLDYNKLTHEAADLLSKYIQIDTTNPPGNELPAARLLREKFLDDGVPATVWEPQPGRGLIAARLHGRGHHTKAIVLLSHIDVAPANAGRWQVPPFSGEIKDGSVWGRGALDDKGPGVIELMAMLAVKRSGRLLNRDIVFLATCDQEQGGKSGAAWVIKSEPRLLSDAGYAVGEGGTISMLPNGRRFYAVSVTEKTPLWLKLTAQAGAGRTATPSEDTAVIRLIRALDRLLDYHPPVRILTPVRDYYRALAQLGGGPPEYNDLPKALRDDPVFARKFLAVARNNALVRDTITATMLSGSSQINMIPTAAEAELDIRLLPGDDPHELERALVKVLDDKEIKTDVMLSLPPASSPRNSSLMSAIAKLAQHEDARVVPAVSPFLTDNNYFRQKGLIVYGFTPIELSPAEEQTIDGVNEHLPIKELGAGIRRLAQLLEYVE